jgi:hypothetical protein
MIQIKQNSGCTADFCIKQNTIGNQTFLFHVHNDSGFNSYFNSTDISVEDSPYIFFEFNLDYPIGEYDMDIYLQNTPSVPIDNSFINDNTASKITSDKINMI